MCDALSNVLCLVSAASRATRPPSKVSPASPINLTDLTKLTLTGLRILSCLLVSYRPLAHYSRIVYKKKGQNSSTAAQIRPRRTRQYLQSG
jgi:hypothetical protein